MRKSSEMSSRKDRNTTPGTKRGFVFYAGFALLLFLFLLAAFCLLAACIRQKGKCSKVLRLLNLSSFRATIKKKGGSAMPDTGFISKTTFLIFIVLTVVLAAVSVLSD